MRRAGARARVTSDAVLCHDRVYGLFESSLHLRVRGARCRARPGARRRAGPGRSTVSAARAAAVVAARRAEQRQAQDERQPRAPLRIRGETHAQLPMQKRPTSAKTRFSEWPWASNTSAMRSTSAASAVSFGGRKQTCWNTFSTWQTENARLAATSSPRLLAP